MQDDRCIIYIYYKESPLTKYFRTQKLGKRRIYLGPMRAGRGRWLHLALAFATYTAQNLNSLCVPQPRANSRAQFRNIFVRAVRQYAAAFANIMLDVMVGRRLFLRTTAACGLICEYGFKARIYENVLTL